MDTTDTARTASVVSTSVRRAVIVSPDRLADSTRSDVAEHPQEVAVQLQEAIDLLSSLRRDAGIFKRDRHVAALSLAIDSLEVQALVGPARASDPATSHRAAPTELRAGSQRARLLAAFHARGMGTSVQACEWADIDPFRGSPWKRVSELKAAGFIEVAGIRVSDGPDREVYSITDKGRAKLGAL